MDGTTNDIFIFDDIVLLIIVVIPLYVELRHEFR
jgi:hypothetical protein